MNNSNPCLDPNRDPEIVCGSVDPDDIRNTLRSQLPLFEECKKKYEPKGKTEFVLSFSVDRLGKVSRSDVINSNVFSSNHSSEKTTLCMNQILKNTDFPRPRGGGSYDVEQPLNLKGN